MAKPPVGEMSQPGYIGFVVRHIFLELWPHIISTPPCPGPKIHSKWVSYSEMERDELATMCMCLRRPKESTVFVFANVDTHIFICFCPSHRQHTGHATSTTVMAYKIFRRIGTRRRELLVAALQHLVRFSLAIFHGLKAWALWAILVGTWMIEKTPKPATSLQMMVNERA